MIPGFPEEGEDSWPTSVIYISKVELTFREMNAIRLVQTVVKNAVIMVKNPAVSFMIHASGC
jgi:hypothetical protein